MIQPSAHTRVRWGVRLLAICLAWLACNLSGEVLTVLHTFTNGPDGAQPRGGLAYDGKFFYGTTYSGGTNGNGTLFRIRPDGNNFATLIDLTTNTGKNPLGSPTTNGASLNFTTTAGGSGNGTMIVINGPGNTNSAYIYSAAKVFSATDGFRCNGSLVLNNGTLYGTMFGTIVPVAPPAGDSVFRLLPTGSSFSVITNLTGQNPVGGLAVGSNVLYGATLRGGNGAGSIFRIDLSTTNYSVIKVFTNLDGASPNGSLLLNDTNLFGTTSAGGAAGNGTVFRLNTNGTEFAVLKSFPAVSAGGSNDDGAYPNGGLVTDGKYLFGTTYSGGSSGEGTIFKINMDGSGFAIVKDFHRSGGAGSVNSNADGACPNGPLLLVGGKLYGTTSSGGSRGDGVVFRLVIPPDIEVPGTNFGVTSNRFGFNISGISNLNVVVEVSSNLVNWSPLGPLILRKNPMFYRDGSFVTNNAQRFYRVRVP